MANEITASGSGDQWMLIVGQLMQRPDFSIDQLERILALRNKELHDRALEAFTADVASCQARVTRADRDKPNPLFRSRYASIEAMYDAVWPAVTESGFDWKVSAIPTPDGWADNIIMFEGVLSKGIISDRVQLPVDRSALVPEGPKGGRPAMTPIQAIGAITTYMRKYLLGMRFNVVTAEDVEADNDGNMGRPPHRSSPPPRPAHSQAGPVASATNEGGTDAPEKPGTGDWLDARTEELRFEEDGGKWLELYKEACRTAPDEAALIRLHGLQAVTDILNAPSIGEAYKRSMNKASAAAFDRLRSSADNDGNHRQPPHTAPAQPVPPPKKHALRFWADRSIALYGTVQSRDSLLAADKRIADDKIRASQPIPAEIDDEILAARERALQRVLAIEQRGQSSPDPAPDGLARHPEPAPGIEDQERLEA